jgi:hypothetical protein
MAFTPATIDLHVIVVEHNDGNGEDPAVFVGRVSMARRETVIHLKDLDPSMIHDDGEAIIAPVRELSDDHLRYDATDEWVEEFLDVFKEATTAPWVTEFARLVTLDVTVAR